MVTRNVTFTNSSLTSLGRSEMSDIYASMDSTCNAWFWNSGSDCADSTCYSCNNVSTLLISANSQASKLNEKNFKETCGISKDSRCTCYCHSCESSNPNPPHNHPVNDNSPTSSTYVVAPPEKHNNHENINQYRVLMDVFGTVFVIITLCIILVVVGCIVSTFLSNAKSTPGVSFQLEMEQFIPRQ